MSLKRFGAFAAKCQARTKANLAHSFLICKKTVETKDHSGAHRNTAKSIALESSKKDSWNKKPGLSTDSFCVHFSAQLNELAHQRRGRATESQKESGKEQGVLSAGTTFSCSSTQAAGPPGFCRVRRLR